MLPVNQPLSWRRKRLTIQLLADNHLGRGRHVSALPQQFLRASMTTNGLRLSVGEKNGPANRLDSAVAVIWRRRRFVLGPRLGLGNRPNRIDRRGPRGRLSAVRY